MRATTRANRCQFQSSRVSFAAIPLTKKSSFGLKSRETLSSRERLRIEDELEAIRYMQGRGAEVLGGLEPFPQDMRICAIHKNAQLQAQELLLMGQLDSFEKYIQQVDDLDVLWQSRLLLGDECWNNYSESFEDLTSFKLQSLRVTPWDEVGFSAAEAKAQFDLYNKKWHDIQVIQAIQVPASASASTSVNPRPA